MVYWKSIVRKVALLGVACVATANPVLAEERTRGEKGSEAPAVSPPADGTENLSTQEREMYGFAMDFAKEIGQIIEGWLKSGAVTDERLFSYLYYPMAGTSPTKFATDYDKLADRDFQAVVDKYMAKSGQILYAVASDRNGYVPTHNRQFSQPLTGNRAMDLVNNRTKRIFGDQVAFRAARNDKPFLLQRSERDTGESVTDISVPIKVRGRHWGCVRVGYRAVGQ